MRQILAMAGLTALAVLTSGCTTITAGTVVPAPTLGHAPKPLAVNALTGLLLDLGDLNTIMGTSTLAVIDSGSTMYVSRIADDDCSSTVYETQRKTYQGTGWLGIQRREIRESSEHWDHIVDQAVVAFPDAGAAHDFYAGQVGTWGNCASRNVNDRDLDRPDVRPGADWSLGTAAEDDGILTISRTQEGGEGWSCQRALAARNNVVIDVDTCAQNISDQGVRVVKQIAEKIPDGQ